MNFTQILHWALNAAKDQAQKAAIAEVQKAAQSLSAAVEKNSPDVSHMIQEQLTKAATTAVAGIMSRRF